jgi:hypothetical protein
MDGEGITVSPICKFADIKFADIKFADIDLEFANIKSKPVQIMGHSTIEP